MPPLENVRRRGVSFAALACALLLQAAAVSADEQSTAPDPAAPSADTDQPSGDTGQPSVKGGPPATASASQAAPPVCFQLTQHCIDAQPQGAADTAQHEQTTSAGADGSSAHHKSGSGRSARRLDLNAPEVSSVVPPQELREPLPSPEEQVTEEESNTVQVAGDRKSPDVPGGFGALWWAIRNPSQAWRIVAPVE